MVAFLFFFATARTAGHGHSLQPSFERALSPVTFFDALNAYHTANDKCPETLFAMLKRVYDSNSRAAFTTAAGVHGVSCGILGGDTTNGERHLIMYHPPPTLS